MPQRDGFLQGKRMKQIILEKILLDVEVKLEERELDRQHYDLSEEGPCLDGKCIFILFHIS